MEASASASEDDARVRPKRHFVTRRELKQKEEELLAKQAAEAVAVELGDDEFDELQEVQETHTIKHGNIRQRTRHGMKYVMFSARFSPDGRYLATCSADKSLCLWDVKTSREVAKYEHQEYVRCVAFSPDGTQLCTGCDDREARIWKVEEALVITDAVHSFMHKDWIVCCCYSPDGRHLCTVSRDSCVLLHDVEAYRLRQGSKETRSSSHRLNSKVNPGAAHDPSSPISPDPSSPSTAKRHVSKKSTVSRASHEDEELPPHKLPLEGATAFASFSKDSQLLVVSSSWEDGLAIIFDVASWDEVLQVPHTDWVTSCSFSPDNRLLLTTSRDKIARVWELPELMRYGQVLQDYKDEKARQEEERKAAEAGKKKLVISKRKQKELAEIAEREALAAKIRAKEMLRLVQKNWTLCAAWSPDGKRIVTGSDTGCVEIWNPKAGNRITKFDQQEQILDLAWSTNGKKVCTTSTDSTARVYSGLYTLWKEEDEAEKRDAFIEAKKSEAKKKATSGR